MTGESHTEELMRAVVASRTGLRTARRISHAYLIDVPDYPRPLLLTDVVVNVAPTLAEKTGIVRNAIDLAHVMGIAQPLVAILAAVETISGRLPSTLDAAALCRMAGRGRITGGLPDGPLGSDNAVSEAAAAEKSIVSPVGGRVDILVVPDLEAGGMLAEALVLLSGAEASGVVLRARVPVALTGRADRSLVLGGVPACRLTRLLGGPGRLVALLDVGPCHGGRPPGDGRVLGLHGHLVLGLRGHLAPVLPVEAGQAGLAGQHLVRALADFRVEFIVHRVSLLVAGSACV
jgi:hypothetical protein